jgi:hypothetical protein
MATSRARISHNATVQARNSWADYGFAAETRIYTQFELAADRITRQINRATAAGKVPPARLAALLGNPHNPHPDSILGVMRQLRPELARQLMQDIRRSVDFGIEGGYLGADAVYGGDKSRFKVGIGTSYIDQAGRVHRYDPRVELYRNSRWAKINGEAMDFLIRSEPKGIMFSQRVWNITNEAQRALRNHVAAAVATGQSAASLSRDIRGMLVAPESLFRRVRRGGKLRLTNRKRRALPDLREPRRPIFPDQRYTRLAAPALLLLRRGPYRR